MKHIQLYEDFHYDKQQLPLFPEQEPTPTDFAHMFVDAFKANKPQLGYNSTGIEKVTDLIAWCKDIKRFWYEVFNNMATDYDKHQLRISEWHKDLNQEVEKYLTQLAEYGGAKEEKALNSFRKTVQTSPFFAIANGQYRDEVIAYFNSLPKEKALWCADDLIETKYYHELMAALTKAASEGNRYVPIYRAVSVPNTITDVRIMLPRYTGVGVYWSYAKSGAIAYSGYHNFKNSIILEARVDVRNIDSYSTLNKSLWQLSEEREIQVKEDCTVELLGFTVNNRQHFQFETPLHVDAHNGIKPRTH